MPIPLALGSAFVLSACAAISDWRTGTIPNWLTLPPALLAPISYGVSHGLGGALQSITALVVSGAVPYLLFRRSAMGGGDVKLFAALGGLTGFDVRVGLEIQLYAFICAMVLALTQRLRKRELRSTLRSAIESVFRGIRSRESARKGVESMTPHKLGVAISLSTFLQCVPPMTHAWSAP